MMRSAAAVACFAGAGCATSMPSQDDVRAFQPHYIMAHEDGYPIRAAPGPFWRRGQLSTRAFREDIEHHLLAGLDRYAEREWGRGNTARLLLFVHGGLNGYTNDFERMKAMLPDPARCDTSERRLFVSDACPRARTNYYPIFVNWNSSLGDSIADDLFFVHFGRRRPHLIWLAPFTLGARMAESVFDAPNSWYANTVTFTDGQPGPGQYLESGAMLPVRGLTTPALKAFGTSAWDIMKRRADLLVADHLPDSKPRRGASISPPARAAPCRALDADDEAEEGAALTLWEMLCDRIDNGGDAERPPRWVTGNGARGPIEITVVGHSMGALVLNRLLATGRALPVQDIVYIAPACSIEEIEWFVRPYQQGTPRRPQFRVFVLNRTDEARETRPVSFVLPRGSLLAWIDNFFEPPTEAGDNRAGRAGALDQYFSDTRAHGICELSGDWPARPRRHDEIASAPYLEQFLFDVNPGAFRPGMEAEPVPCSPSSP